jgi:hypothetical protein
VNPRLKIINPVHYFHYSITPLFHFIYETLNIVMGGKLAQNWLGACKFVSSEGRKS